MLLMIFRTSAFVCVCMLVTSLRLAGASEFTFELPDGEKACFYEDIKKGEECVLEYQVIEGGNYDVDVIISSGSRTLYNREKKQYDQTTWTAEDDGEYRFCFGNEFSTLTHKVVYFDFHTTSDDDPFPEQHKTHPALALTQMESNAATIHRSLRLITDYQTHHRLRESQGRVFAENLSERVQYWSLCQTVFILLAGIGQVIILRSFFSERKTTQDTTAHT